jgi:hypothetical protein
VGGANAEFKRFEAFRALPASRDIHGRSRYAKRFLSVLNITGRDCSHTSGLGVQRELRALMEFAG